MELGDSGLSLGGGVSWSGLGAVDGVEHLYQLSSAIEQSGHMADFRLGIFSNRDERHFEVVLLHNRFDMTHEVTYVDWIWDSVDQWVLTSRVETNLDQTRTTGLHLGFARPITASGWRFGGSWTVNRKSHPKIPNYEIMNIPRDPGISWARHLRDRRGGRAHMEQHLGRGGSRYDRARRCRDSKGSEDDRERVLLQQRADAHGDVV